MSLWFSLMLWTLVDNTRVSWGRVEQWMTSQGWVKLEDKASLNFTLKWVEVRQHIDFKNFREGEQLVNHFPNIQVLTTKIGLLESLRTYCKLRRFEL